MTTNVPEKGSYQQMLSVLQILFVFFMTATIAIKQTNIEGIKWWLGLIFSFSVFAAVIYETVIKPAHSAKTPVFNTCKEIILRWILPLIIGYSVAKLLIWNGLVK
jgi:hypothetical protein